MLISIVIPARNEAGNIGHTVDNLENKKDVPQTRGTGGHLTSEKKSTPNTDSLHKSIHGGIVGYVSKFDEYAQGNSNGGNKLLSGTGYGVKAQSENWLKNTE